MAEHATTMTRQPVSIYGDKSGTVEIREKSWWLCEAKDILCGTSSVMEFLEDGSDGYPTSAYFAVSTRYGTPADFAALVDELHQVGIGVILDWSPAQFPRYAGGLEGDGTLIYGNERPGNGSPPDVGHHAL